MAEQLVEEGLGIELPASPAQALCLSAGGADYQAYVDGIEELEAYVAFYLKQDLGKMQDWDLPELRRRFGNVLEIVRAQNGRAEGEVRGDF